MSPAFPTDRSQVTDETLAHFRKLIRRASRGDADAFSEVQPLVDAPNALACFGGLADVAGKALAHMASGDNLIRRKLTTREMEQWRDELLGPAPTALDRMLVERVVFARLQVLDAETRLADCGMEDWDFYQRRLDHAHRRFLAAVRALDLVRRKLAPALQVNIAQQQVNVAAADALTREADAIRDSEAPAEPVLPARQEPRRPELAPDSRSVAPASPPAERPAVLLRPPQVRRFETEPGTRDGAVAPSPPTAPSSPPRPSAIPRRPSEHGRLGPAQERVRPPAEGRNGMLRPPQLRRFRAVRWWDKLFGATSPRSTPDASPATLSARTSEPARPPPGPPAA